MQSFPTGAAYVDALHHPDLCLTDPRLAGATVELTAAGWPRPRSGANACVFQLDGADNARYALKCFTRSGPGQQQRYAAIAEQLAVDRSDWQVIFEYQEEGILVEGTRWPVLVMEWVDGARDLAGFVADHLHQPALLGRLAGEFAATCADLTGRGIAHGDLQHGNVLVTSAARSSGHPIRLIDYDGMWVPGLADRPGVERGHPNFQHPARRVEHSGPALDHFSGWVGYISLLACAADADIWQRLDGGDECLIFRAADFTDPAGSMAFAALADSPEPVVREAGAHLAELCREADPQRVPPLDATAFPVPKLPGRRRLGADSRTTSRPVPTPSTASGPATAAGSYRRLPRASARRRRPATSSRWSRRRPWARSARATMSLQRGRVLPGGARPPAGRLALRVSGFISAVAGAVFLLVQLAGGSSSGTTAQRLGVPPYSAPAANGYAGLPSAYSTGSSTRLCAYSPGVCNSGLSSAYRQCLLRNLIVPPTLGLPEGVLSSLLASPTKPAKAKPSRKPSPKPRPSPSPSATVSAMQACMSQLASSPTP